MLRKVSLGLASAAFALLLTTTAIAGHGSSGVKSYTGCLVPNDGVIVKVKEGNAPKSACTGGQVEAHLSGGDLTEISVGNGLVSTPNPDENGAVRIELAAGQTLPSGCAAGRVVEWSGSAWVCGVDDDTTYSADETTLTLSGTQFSVKSDYRVKNTPDCSSGQVATGFDSSGNIQCVTAPASPVGYSARTPTSFVNLDFATFVGTPPTEVVSLDLAPGTYVLFAAIHAVNADDDDGSFVTCVMPGANAISGKLDEEVEPGEIEVLAMTSAVTHAGGAVRVMCARNSSDNDNTRAWGNLTAIKVGSIG